MNKPILFLLGLLFVVSCTEQSDVPPHQAKQPEVQHNSPTRTPQEAQNEVADFLAAMGKKTRSATRPTIANVETLRSRQFATRAAVDTLSIDTLLYFVNFADNQGFAVVAADKRTSPILALIDKGNYKAKDLAQEDNPGFLSFMEQAITHEINNSQQDLQSSQAIRSFSYGNDWEISELFQPLIKVNWDQGHPYNIFCPGYKDKAHAYTGCVVTAIAQICSYYKIPRELSWNSYGTQVHWTYDWERILSDCAENNGKIDFDEVTNRKYVLTAGEVASLMNYLGLALNATYKEQTGVPTDKAIDWIRRSGWFYATKHKDYDERRIFQALKDGLLIFTTGYDHKSKTWLVFNKYKEGHAWLMDGYIHGRYKSHYYNLLHCNWGWDGRHNGYYLSKVFNTNNPANLPSTISPPPVRSNVPYYFQYNLQYSIIYTTK